VGVGLSALRGGSALADLLFLFDCHAERPTALQPIAERLGITVQAVSQTYRRLARRRLAEFHDGHYRATLEGVERLHAILGGVAEDVNARQRQLSVIRTVRAIAGGRIARGDRVSLGLVNGLLSAVSGGRGPSVGRALASAQRGDLLEVGELQGIMPITPGTVELVTLPVARIRAPDVKEALARVVRDAPPGLLAAEGLEAAHLLGRITSRPFARFATGASAAEASRVGVPSTVVLLEEELPRFLSQWALGRAPPLTVRAVGRAPAPGPAHRRGRPRARRTVIRKSD
jgi:predicted transcriptional regulator